MKFKTMIILGFLLIAAALVLAACGSTEETQLPAPVLEPTTQGDGAQVTQAPCPTAEACPEAVAGPADQLALVELWANSPHNDVESEAFAHWNEEDPAVVEESCARCHSGLGFQDFIGADGSAAGSVEVAPAIGSTIDCVACHNDAARSMTSVVFPSGVEVTGLGGESRCLQCHQGRASKVQVDEAIAKAGDWDTVIEDQGFINIHYYAAAATQYGTITKGGYEYDGKSYDAKFGHVAGYDTCIGCHNSHSLELKVDECSACHTGVASREDLAGIRMAGSLVDYDGDGDMEEGIGEEIAGLQEILLGAINSYTGEAIGTPAVYNVAAYPYWFIDTNANGTADEDESVFDNAFTTWNGHALAAAYNYQVSLKDPGGFAHGGKYLIQLLYDSIEDLNTVLSTPVDMAGLHRIDNGHFAGSEEAFRHWDADGLVPADCAKCHSATGLPQFLDEASRNRDGVTGIVTAQHISNGFQCATCHNDLTTFSRTTVNAVKFPSGAVLAFAEGDDANLCLECHQGRESKVSVDAAINRAGVGDDEVTDALSFRNPHYFATGATLFGTEAKGAYEYNGQTYNGRFMHVESMDTCIECHDAHALQVQTQVCAGCHGTEEVTAIRFNTSTDDYDGDGDVTEGLAGEVQTMHEALYTAIQETATTAGVSIVYDAHAYPYWFTDANSNGTLDEGEGGFATWTPRLLRAAYNYQWVAKDPGAFAHNGKYIIQVLYDSLNDLGVDVTNMVRPAAPEATP